MRSLVIPVAVQHGPALRLMREATVASLLAGTAHDHDRFEASGVVLQDGLLWIIFDNLPDIAAVDPSLTPGRSDARLVRQPGRAAGYEDIACDEATGRRFVVIEAARTPEGGFKPQIDEFDAAWRLIGRRWVDLAVERPNKGLEGLTCVRRDGDSYLLALSEGNGSPGGRRGRRPGRGLVHVLRQQGDAWTVVDRIQLPEDLGFADHSGISVRGDRIAVVSQESSALWVGKLDPHRWQVVDGGRIHPFPRDRRGRALYGAVEGVCWLDDWTVATVTDRTGRRRPRRLRATAESVQVFAFPRGGHTARVGADGPSPSP